MRLLYTKGAVNEFLVEPRNTCNLQHKHMRVEFIAYIVQ